MPREYTSSFLGKISSFVMFDNSGGANVFVPAFDMYAIEFSMYLERPKSVILNMSPGNTSMFLGLMSL